MSSARFVAVSIILITGFFGIEIWQYGFLIWQTPVLIFIIILLLVAWQKIRMLRSVLSTGLGTRKSNIDSSILEFFKNAKKAENEIEIAFSSIKDIGQDTFPERIKNIDSHHIKDSLLGTHEKISALRKNEQEKNWITLGVAAITGLKHKGNDEADYAFQVISSTVKYLNVNQGAFFILRETQGEIYFELLGSYAYGKKKYLDKRIDIGEGLIGQVYYEKDIILLTEVPGNYVKITSGLGEALPRCICIIPLMSEGKIYGALEIASFTRINPFEIEYLKSVGETVGYSLMAIDRNQKTEQLLSESQQMAQEVKSQQEELRQNMEELTATQEQMQRKQGEMDAVLASLAVIELDTNGEIQEANSVFLGLTGYNRAELNRKMYLDLIPEQGNDRTQYEMMWASLMAGRTFSGEFRIRNSKGTDLWMLGNFTPLLDLSGKPYKVMVISLFTTQDKEKLIELQEMVTALKSCFPIAEINPDLTFRSANELFLTELGIKRLDLKKLILKDTFYNGSFQKVESFFLGDSNQAYLDDIHLQCKNGEVRPFNATLAKVNTHDRLKKGILILRKSVGE